MARVARSGSALPDPASPWAWHCEAGWVSLFEAACEAPVRAA